MGKISFVPAFCVLIFFGLASCVTPEHEFPEQQDVTGIAAFLHPPGAILNAQIPQRDWS